MLSVKADTHQSDAKLNAKNTRIVFINASGVTHVDVFDRAFIQKENILKTSRVFFQERHHIWIKRKWNSQH